MRDCGNNRTGFERVLMAVAATFLTVSAGSALAQSDPSRSSPAELAIDAAIPRPEPANLGRRLERVVQQAVGLQLSATTALLYIALASR